MHSRSIAIYNQDKERLSGRRQEIWNWMLQSNRSFSDREVKDGMGFSDMNDVRPRITELIKIGFAVETGAKFCPVTHKEVRAVKALPLGGSEFTNPEPPLSEKPQFSGLFDNL